VLAAFPANSGRSTLSIVDTTPALHRHQQGRLPTNGRRPRARSRREPTRRRSPRE
jgi:hypothetical protein